MSKIFLDAGHGGHDSGAIGSRSKEKDNNLEIALATGDKLKKLGHTIKYSRKTDKYLTLSTRTSLANAWGADIFISVHNNSAASSVTGFETFIYNGAVGATTKRLQNDLHHVIAKGLKIQDRGEKRADFAVLRQTKMPAILIEYGFISNVTDENILMHHTEHLATLTANGVAKFFGQSPLQEDKQNDIASPSHATAWKKASNENNQIFNGEDPQKPLTREQAATILDRLGLLK